MAAAEGYRPGAIAVVFCSDAYLLEVNNNFLNHNYFTDIITFDDSDLAHGVIAGDLLISIDTVASNARQFGVDFATELQRVIVHGILHLCGYGDKTPSEEARMRRLEDHYLAQCEVPSTQTILTTPDADPKSVKGEPAKA